MAYKRKIMSTLVDGPDWVARFVGDGRFRRNAFGSGGLWIWLILTYFFSVPAMAILPAAGLLLIYSSLSPTTPVRIAVLVMFAIGLVDVLLGLLFRPKFRLVRRIPPRIRAGSVFTVEYAVENRRKRSAFDLEFDPDFGVRYFECLEPARLDRCRGRETVAAVSQMRASLRGKYLMGPPRAVSRFPFGLVKFHTTTPEPPSTILVYPAYTPLRELDLPTGRRFQSSGLNRVSKVSEAADFCGCRDWREGDNFRHIHWRGSARTGKMIVKEFQEEYLSRAALIIDACVPGISEKRRSPSLEAALSLAAGAADFLMADEFVIDLFVAGSNVRYFQAGRSIANFESMLDVLAAVEAEKTLSITRLEERVMDEINGIGSALLILLELDAERLGLIDSLRSAGTAVKTVLVAEQPPAETVPGLIHLTPDYIFQGKLTGL